MDEVNVLTLGAVKYEPAHCLQSMMLTAVDCEQFAMAPSSEGMKIEDTQLTSGVKPERKKAVRFDGFPEEEIFRRRVPDHLVPDLDILMIGTNPGPFAAFKGHHYAGPGNHFWKCLHMSGLIPEQLSADDDYKLIDYGIGFTNIVDRATRTMADLKSDEIKDGAKTLLEKIRFYRPRIVVFNGKEIYKMFSGKKEFCFGKQPVYIDGTQTIIYVMPSSSARFSQLPRVADKVPYYVALKKLRDHIRGDLPCLTEPEIVFSSVLAMAPRKKGAGGKAGTESLPKKAGSIVKKHQSQDLACAGDMGLDDDGRPLLPSRLSFDLHLVKNERSDDEEVDEYIEPTSFARQSAVEMLGAERCSSTPTTDLSEFFMDPLPVTLPPYPQSNSFNIVCMMQYPATSSQESDVGANGENGNDETTGSTSQPQEQQGANGDENGDVVTHVQDGSYQHQAPSVQQCVPVPHPFSPHVSQHHMMAIAEQQQINGVESVSVPSTMEQSPAAVAFTPGNQRQEVATSGRGHHGTLPPEVARHVEEAIENVIQRAREGPLDMPAFRTHAEKVAAGHAQQHLHQHQQHQQQQQQQQHQHQQQQQQQHQQQQQQQQQMFANLQAHAAAMAAAAHFDLSGRMKTQAEPMLSLGGGSGQGASSGEHQLLQSGTPSSLYQYFQPQQPHRSNQGVFTTASSSGSGNTGANMAGSGTNYGQWPTTTSNAGQQMVTASANNLYNPAMTAQFYPNFTPQTAVNQQLYSAVGAAPLTGFSGSPYFTAAQQHQQVAAAMYGQYAASGGFVSAMQQQQQQQQQQQSPHNL